MSLASQLKTRIREQGPLSVAEFMDAALADPTHGYYMTRDPFGTGGDFTTAPEISQIFGELLGAWIAQAWQLLGRPSPFCLLELGPGRGTLMADALRATKNVPGFHAALHLCMYEMSPVLIALQKRTLADAHPRSQWITGLSELSDLPLLFIANEFFDALPIRQFSGSEERKVTLQGDTLAFTLPDTGLRETCEPATSIVGILAAHLKKHTGAGIIIDYGYAGASTRDTLQAVQNHAYVDPLTDPGSADLTAHVAFDALADAARYSGATAHGPVPQGMFLRRLGAELRAAQLCVSATQPQRERILSGLARIMSPDEMGELFKALALCYPDIPDLHGFT